MVKTTLYTVGGTVQAGGGLYIKRTADDELLELCRKGEFAFILSSRQVGKSSLMVRTAQQLENENIRAVIIDLSAIGVKVSIDEWYLGILNEVATTLNLETSIFTWWTKYAQLGPAQRLTNFFKDVVLKEVNEQIVLFFDEIDSTLSIPFSDDFYIALRAAHNARSTTSEFKRLSFVLVGVAAPSDLISDNKRTPFNIGRRVELNDFTLTEALPLADGLGEQAVNALTWIFQYTGGHPYLTQRLCDYLAKSKGFIDEQAVSNSVEQLFMGEQGRQDNNLQFVRDMLSQRSPDVTRVMLIYRDIRTGKKVVDDERSIAKAHLKLSGLVRSENGLLEVRNEIYNRIFNLRWIQENTPNNWTKIIAFSFGIVTFLLLFIFIFDFVVDNSVSRKVDTFYGSQDPSVKLKSLAQIFDAEGILPNADYNPRARELFFSLTAKDQEALFMNSSDSAKQQYLTAVVRGLYVTMANVEGGQSSTDLLGIIKVSLGSVDTNTSLIREIDMWLQARNAATPQDALSKYNEIIQLNPDNPATYYERAVIEIKLGQFEQALSDLDTTMRLAQSLSSEASEEGIATPTPLPTVTESPRTTATASFASPNVTQPPGLTVSSTVATSTIQVAPTQLTVTEELIATSTTEVGLSTQPSPTQPAPVSAPTLRESYKSSFFSRAYIRSAVELLIQSNISFPDFRNLLINIDTYPDLANNGLLPAIETPTVLQLEQQALILATATSILRAVPTDTPLSATDTPAAPARPVLGGADLIAFVANNEIWVMNVDGSELKQLTTDGASKNDLQWLPDGETILFVSGKDVKYYNISNDTNDTLTSFPETVSLDSFQVSHDGTQVMIAMSDEIFVVPFDFERFKSIRSRNDLFAMQDACITPVGKTLSALRVRETRWSADDKLVAWLFIGVDSNDDVLRAEQVSVFDITACDPELIDMLDNFPGTRFNPVGYQNREMPDFDWDGFAQFTFNTSRRNDGWGEFYIYNYINHKPTLVYPVNNVCCYRDLRWSPDGTHIFFSFQDLGVGAAAPTQLYYVSAGLLETGVTFQPLPLPEGFFKNPKEGSQAALRPALP